MTSLILNKLSTYIGIWQLEQLIILTPMHTFCTHHVWSLNIQYSVYNLSVHWAYHKISITDRSMCSKTNMNSIIQNFCNLHKIQCCTHEIVNLSLIPNVCIITQMLKNQPHTCSQHTHSKTLSWCVVWCNTIITQSNLPPLKLIKFT